MRISLIVHFLTGTGLNAITQYRILCNYRLIDLAALSDNGVIHDNGITYHGALAYLDIAADDGAVYFTINLCTFTNKASLHLALRRDILRCKRVATSRPCRS